MWLLPANMFLRVKARCLTNFVYSTWKTTKSQPLHNTASPDERHCLPEFNLARMGRVRRPRVSEYFLHSSNCCWSVSPTRIRTVQLTSFSCNALNNSIHRRYPSQYTGSNSIRCGLYYICSSIQPSNTIRCRTIRKFDLVLNLFHTQYGVFLLCSVEVFM